RLHVRHRPHVGKAFGRPDDRVVPEVGAHHRAAEADAVLGDPIELRDGHVLAASRPVQVGEEHPDGRGGPRTHPRLLDLLVVQHHRTPLAWTGSRSGPPRDRGPSDAYGENIPTGGSPPSAQPPGAGGRAPLHGCASSSWAATRTRTSSAPCGATSCTPTGRPDAVRCSGSEIAGCPVTRKGMARHWIWRTRGRRASGSSGGGTSSSRSAGGSPVVGVTSR